MLNQENISKIKEYFSSILSNYCLTNPGEISNVQFSDCINLPLSLSNIFFEMFPSNENSIYKGCPSCSKKLSELKEQNKFGCLPCNKMYNEPKYTFILIIRVRDANDNAYFKLIGTKANKILGIEPEQLKQLLDAKRFRDIESLEKVVSRVEYVTFYEGKLEGCFVRLPERRELNADIDESMIVEFYNR